MRDPLGRTALVAWLLSTSCFSSIDLDRLDAAPATESCAPGDPPPCPDEDETLGLPDDVESAGCPPDMVRVVGPSVFCIDRTEVTNQAYARFLAEDGADAGDEGEDVGDESRRCGWKFDSTPTQWPVEGAKASHPVVGVDWCDAQSYCQARSKRLCGAFGEATTRLDPAGSEWSFACTRGGAWRFPYGEHYMPHACNGGGGPSEDSSGHGSGRDRSTTAPVGDPSCEGGSDGLFDMSGNVDEWVDACDGAEGASDGKADSCWALGGNFLATGEALACVSANASPTRRDFRAPTRGFRCCR